MNRDLAYIIMRGVAQGATPATIADRIEHAYQTGAIEMPESKFTVQCVDCFGSMEAHQQGQHTIVTCKNKSCTLYGVTLSTDQYISLTPIQLEGYRKMVAQFKERNHDV